MFNGHSDRAKLLSAMLFVPASLLFASARLSWPEVEPVSQTFLFADVNRDSVALFLHDRQGKEVYWFGCHSADFTGDRRDPFHDDEYYYGMFDCHLHQLNDKKGFNLLSYGSDHLENFSRALTVPEELQGRCADYPEWGHLRHIRLRAMRITLNFSDLVFGPKLEAAEGRRPEGKQVKSFRLDLRIDPDNDARSSIAEPAGYAFPLRTLPGSTKNISNDCSEVVRDEAAP